MHSITFRRAASAAAATLMTIGLVGIAPTATAGDTTEPEPCAAEQAKVDKAQAKLDELQAVFAKEKKQLKAAEKKLEKADTKKEKKHAKEQVAEEKQDVAKAKKAKKAQVQRLAKAQERLDACLAAQPTDPPTEG